MTLNDNMLENGLLSSQDSYLPLDDMYVDLNPEYMEPLRLARELFQRGDYERSIYSYVWVLLKSVGKHFSPEQCQIFYTESSMVSFLHSIYTKMDDIMNDNPYIKGLILFSISQCVNNITAKNYNPRDYESVKACSTAQKLALVYYRKAVNIFRELNIEVSFDTLMLINYIVSMLEVNLGIILSSDVTRRFDRISYVAGKSNIKKEINWRTILENCLSRIEILIRYDAQQKYFVAKSTILSRLGNDKESEDALNDAILVKKTDSPMMKKAEMYKKAGSLNRHTVHLLGEK